MAWPIVAAAGIGAAGNAASAYMQYRGAEQMNENNLRIVREQMQFQERMSNTAYQRSRADAMAAGFNPLLAFTQGGASTPQGSAIPMQNEMAGSADSVRGGTSSALDAMRVSQEIKNMKMANDNLKATNDNIKADTKLKGDQAFTTFLNAGVALNTAKKLASEGKLLNAALPAAENAAAAEKSFGKPAAYFDRFFQSLDNASIPFKPGSSAYSNHSRISLNNYMSARR